MDYCYTAANSDYETGEHCTVAACQHSVPLLRISQCVVICDCWLVQNCTTVIRSLLLNWAVLTYSCNAAAAADNDGYCGSSENLWKHPPKFIHILKSKKQFLCYNKSLLFSWQLRVVHALYCVLFMLNFASSIIRAYNSGECVWEQSRVERCCVFHWHFHRRS